MRNRIFLAGLTLLLLIIPNLSRVRGDVPAAPVISFTASGLAGEALNNPTSLQFGPDGRLYVSQQDGTIYAYTVVRNAPNTYAVTATETINLVKSIPNHDDTNGAVNATVNTRQVTGLYVTGTGTNPILYVSSSDPRIGAGGSGTDKDLDTNSGVVSRLNWTGSAWNKVDLVRGLPRSEENHSVNGIQIDPTTNMLYLAVGGHTNAGSPSNNFAFITEYALAAAIVSIDLDMIDAMPVLGTGNNKYVYDIPTLDDPTRANVGGKDPNDPFGGNDGFNQAKIVAGGPVQIYSPGYRNPYDLVLTQAGRMYVVDNGANGGWGGHPAGEGTANCTNEYLTGEPGSSTTGPGGDPPVNNLDNLHYVPGPGYYAGHAHPIRGNPTGAGLYTYDGTGTWRTTPAQLPVDWPPVPDANPVECDYRQAGVSDGALATWPASTNGLAEYTADNFEGQMQGNLLTASFDGTISRIILNAAGTAATSVTTFASGFGSIPLDLVAQGEGESFAGTIWVAAYGADSIVIFEPSDYDGAVVVCTGADDAALDEDNDGYTNADEIDNGTNPCSGASKPEDWDSDLISNLNDPDDDNDTLLDTVDRFAIDATNGASTTIPVAYNLLNNDPGTGFYGVGFTGLMVNGSNYENLFNATSVIAGGTSGLFTIPDVSAGTAASNTQQNGFQFGLNVNSGTTPFTIHARMLPPFFAGNPQDFQSQGIYIGTGDQDNYLKVVLHGNDGDGGIQVAHEFGGSYQSFMYGNADLLDAVSNIDVYLSVNPAAGTIQPKYSIDGGLPINAGPTITVSGSSLNALQGTYQVNGLASKLAVGFISTSTGSGQTFAATWDFVNITENPSSETATVQIGLSGGNINSSTVADGSFRIVNTSASGAKITTVRFDTSTAILPDLLFDPNGTAGDTAQEAFQPNSGSAAVGLGTHNFLNARDGGFEVLEINFNDFGAGETFTFSVDVDPTSIQGTTAPGPGDSGSVSGLELTGTRVTVTYDTGVSQTIETYHSSQSSSQNIVRSAAPATPAIELLNNPTNPVTVTQANQTVRVNGPVETDVRLLMVESELFIIGTGYDVDPYEANSALRITEITGFNTGPSGVVDIPVTLTKTGGGGLNYIVAVLTASDGMTSPNSNTLVVKYDPLPPPVSTLRINSGGPQVITGGQTWIADQYFTGGNTYTTGAGLPIANTTDDPIYRSERHGNFSYAIPIPNGTYEVRLHFAEIWHGVQNGNGEGARRFNTTIEGVAVLSNYDILSEVPPATAIIKAFPDIVVTDGFINIVFTRVVDNSLLSGIEILQPGAPTAQLEATPTNTNFFSQVVGIPSAPQQITLTNIGAVPLDVTGVTLTGTNGSLFTHDFASAYTLNPGISAPLNITFTPDTPGLKVATIQVQHTGSNPTVEVNLTGEAIANTPPTVANPIADVTVVENDPPSNIDLATVFTDVEHPNNLTLTIQDNTNSALVDALLSTNQLILTYTADTTGTADITIRATDPGGLFIEDTFTVIVEPPNTPPTVANPIGDVTVIQDSAPTDIDLASVFTDLEDATLTLMVQTNTNPGLVDAALNGTQLTLTYTVATTGTADITIRATDSKGLFVEDTFTLTVNPANTPPTVANPIADVNVIENDPPTVIDLTAVFTDLQDPVSDLTITLLDNTNPALVTEAFSSVPSPYSISIELTYAADTSGTATITLRATDTDGLSVDETFVVTVADSNTPPTVVNPIADMSVLPNSAPTDIDLATVFDDVQDGTAGLVLSVQNNDNPTLVTPTLIGTQLTLTYGVNETGLATITIRATDSEGLFVEDTFTVNVGIPNSPPTVANPIADVSDPENSAPRILDLTGTFTDVEDATLTLSVPLNDNPALVTPSFNGEQLTLTYTPNGFGTATITVRATDSGGLSVDDIFIVTITPVNTPPVVVNPIADVTVDENSAPTAIDLTNIFSDVEDATLILSVENNTNGGLVTPSLNGNQLTLTYAAQTFGIADMTLRATDSEGLFVEDVFVVTVNDVPNTPPVVSNPIADVTVNENSAPTIIDLTVLSVFTDAEDATLSMSIQGNSDPGLVTPAFLTGLPPAGTQLILSYTPDTFGTSTITIRATDSEGLFAEDTFVVTVLEINTPPIVANAIADVAVNENAAPSVIDLTGAFTDIEDPTLVLSVQNNTNGVLVTPTLNGAQLTLTYAANGFGTADLSIRATDSGGLFVEDTFTVTVTEINSAPTIANLITDLTVNENSLPSVRDLAGVFEDVEDGSAGLTLSLQSNTNAALANTVLNGTQLTLTYTPNAFGIADVTIRATDSGGLFIEDTFTVTVNEVPNTPPTVANPIADVTVNENSVPTVIDLASVFTDAEDTSLVLFISNNTNAGLVTPSLNGTQLTLTYAPASTGTADITIRATDSEGASIEDTFTVTVAAGNTSPVVVNPIADVNVNENDPASVLDLTAVFDDAEDGAAGLVLSIQNNDNPALVTPTLNGTQLTLTYAANTFGTANLTFRATDTGGLFVEDTVVVTVASVNAAPTIATPLADENVNENSAPIVIELAGLFTDSEDGSAGLVLSVENNTNNTLVSAALNGTQLTLTLANNEFGTADITIRATDSEGLFVEDTMTLTVNEIPNTLPTVANPIADVSVNENSAPTVIDLANVFTDAEDGLTLTLFVQDNTNTSLVSGVLNGTQLTLTYAPNATGTALITLRATDSDGGFVEETFMVTVSNGAPIATNDDYSVISGEVLTVTAPGVLVNDTFTGNLTLTATQPAQGQVVIQNNGSFTYTLTTTAFTGIDTFTYTLDNGSSTATATVTIHITPRDSVAPKVIDVMIPNGTGGFLHTPASTTLNFNQIQLQFSEDVKFADAMENYHLFSAGINGVFDTGDCAAIAVNGLGGDDTRYPIALLSYNAHTATITLSAGLPVGSYRLMACGTTSIEDLVGNKLDGNGDGIGNDDFIWNFAVTTPAPTGGNNTTTTTTTTTTVSPSTASVSTTSVTSPTTNLPTTLPATGSRPPEQKSQFGLLPIISLVLALFAFVFSYWLLRRKRYN